MMKYVLILGIILFAAVACRQKAETPFNACVISERIVRADGMLDNGSATRTRIRCKGDCEGGVPCDSTIELTNTSMGASVRRVKCGCAGDAPGQGCGIVIEHTRHTEDSIVSRIFCSHRSDCAITTDTCMLQERGLPDEMIPSRITGEDSLIVQRWAYVCACVGRG